MKLYSSLDLNQKITKIYLLRNQCFLPWLEISQLIWIMHRNQRFNLITFSKLSLCHKSRNYYVSNQLNPICFRLNLKCTFKQFEYSIQFKFIFIKSRKVFLLSIFKKWNLKQHSCNITKARMHLFFQTKPAFSGSDWLAVECLIQFLWNCIACYLLGLWTCYEYF